MKWVTGLGRVRVQEQAIEGNDPHGAYGRLCKGEWVLVGVSQGTVQIKLLCFRWLSPFLKLV